MPEWIWIAKLSQVLVWYVVYSKQVRIIFPKQNFAEEKMHELFSISIDVVVGWFP